MGLGIWVDIINRLFTLLLYLFQLIFSEPQNINPERSISSNLLEDRWYLLYEIFSVLLFWLLLDQDFDFFLT
jgi:hypothetical protein